MDIRGGAPGTSETDALDPANLVGAVDAIALSGGSVYGLEARAAICWRGWARAAAASACARMRRRRRSFRAPSSSISQTAATNNGEQTRPIARSPSRPAERAAADFALGKAGAGFGATAGMYKGGTGSASVVTGGGFTLGAHAIVNSLGSPVIPHTDVFWASPYECDGEFGGWRLPPDFQRIDASLPPDMKQTPQARCKHDARRRRDGCGTVAHRTEAAGNHGVGRCRARHSTRSHAVRRRHRICMATGGRAIAEPRPFPLVQLGNAAARLSRAGHRARRS